MINNLSGVFGGRFVGGSGSVFGSRSGSISALGCGRVLSLSLVFHISDESTVVISGVGHNLGTAVGEGDAVFTVDNTFGVLGLRLSRSKITQNKNSNKTTWAVFYKKLGRITAYIS